MIETVCSEITFHKLMDELNKQFDFSKDYYMYERYTYSNGNNFSICVNKYTDEIETETKTWKPKCIDVNGVFIHIENVLETKLTPKPVAVVVITDNFATIYDKSLYKWMIKLVKKYDLDHNRKYEIIRCW